MRHLYGGGAGGRKGAEEKERDRKTGGRVSIIIQLTPPTFYLPVDFFSVFLHTVGLGL